MTSRSLLISDVMVISAGVRLEAGHVGEWFPSDEAMALELARRVVPDHEAAALVEIDRCRARDRAGAPGTPLAAIVRRGADSRPDAPRALLRRRLGELADGGHCSRGGGRREDARGPIPRAALTVPEAAASFAVGPDFFDQYIRPELRVIRRGSKRLVPVAELERWAAENASRVLE